MIENVTDKTEIKLLGAAISDTDFLRNLFSIYDENMFSNKHIRKAVLWCLDYYKEHGESPETHIEDLFYAWAATEKEDVHIEMMKEIIIRASVIKIKNYKHMVKLAVGNLNKNNIRRVNEQLTGCLANGDIEEAHKVLAMYSGNTEQKKQWINPYTDCRVIQNAFEIRNDPLLEFGGAFGLKYNKHFTRGSLINFMGIEKRGKTWWLHEMGVAGLRANRNVAWISCGDMDEEEMTQRSGARSTGTNCTDNIPDDGKNTIIPCLDCILNQKGDCKSKYRKGKGSLNILINEYISDFEGSIDSVIDYVKANIKNGYRPCSVCLKDNPRLSSWFYELRKIFPTRWRDVYKTGTKYMKHIRGDIRLCAFPNSTVKPTDIIAILRGWAAENWIADVVVIDYADIMESDRQYRETRNNENEIWKSLKKIAQQFDVLVVTATQADAGGYGKQSLDMGNFSNDKRKYAHVNLSLSLNQTNIEKIFGLMRVGTLVQRTGFFEMQEEVTVLQALSIGNAHIDSFIRKPGNLS